MLLREVVSLKQNRFSDVWGTHQISGECIIVIVVWSPLLVCKISISFHLFYTAFSNTSPIIYYATSLDYTMNLESSSGWSTERIFGCRSLVSWDTPFFSTSSTTSRSRLENRSNCFFSNTNTDASYNTQCVLLTAQAHSTCKVQCWKAKTLMNTDGQPTTCQEPVFGHVLIIVSVMWPYAW